MSYAVEKLLTVSNFRQALSAVYENDPEITHLNIYEPYYFQMEALRMLARSLPTTAEIAEDRVRRMEKIDSMEDVLIGVAVHTLTLAAAERTYIYAQQVAAEYGAEERYMPGTVPGIEALDLSLWGYTLYFSI